MDGYAFEEFLYLWEFFTNFNEYLDIPLIRMDELQAALTYSNYVKSPEEDKLADLFSQDSELKDEENVHGLSWE